MKKHSFIILLLFFILNSCISYSKEYLYILNDECINNLYLASRQYFMHTPIETLKDSRGIILRYKFEDAREEYKNLNKYVYKKIEDFLSKFDNLVIIEVHLGKKQFDSDVGLKRWEYSTLIANQIENIITVPQGKIEQRRVHSVGYGEFLPYKNTSNNGGKYLNRVDIIILCNISGE